MTRVSEAIRGLLGWCPNAHAPIRNNSIYFNNEEVIASFAGGSFKDRANHWLGLFRNQILLFAITMSATGFWLYAGLGGWSNPLLFISGIVVGILISAVIGNWYRRIFNEVLHEGPVILWNRYDQTSGTIAMIIFLAFEGLTICAIFGGIPGISFEMTNAVFGGFIAVVFWGQFASIRKWEWENCKMLHYDGMILELEKEENHVPY